MTCKDCIHSGVCKWNCVPPLAEQCEDFKNKDRFVELPVKVGQTVWCILNRAKPQKFQIKIVSMTENFYSFVIEAHKGVYKHYCDQNSVGRVVFFTEEEAKKALEGSKE